MNYYQTSEDGVLLSGPHVAPLSRGGSVLLFPAGAVTETPPAEVEGFVRVWLEGAWTQQPIPEQPTPPEPDPIPEGRKVWPNSSTFLKTFTAPEQAAISLSTNPTVAALRLLLVTHPGEVWSDDPDIVLGLDTLVSLNIISQVRREEIEQPEEEV